MEPIDALAKVVARTGSPEGIIKGLARYGFTIADIDNVFSDPNEHLRLLKSMRRRLAEVVDNPDTPPRDLASNSRRLQDVSREVTSIEEKLSAEKRTSGKSNTNGARAATRKPGFNPAQV